MAKKKVLADDYKVCLSAFFVQFYAIVDCYKK